jgi:hypothetical protein
MIFNLKYEVSAKKAEFFGVLIKINNKWMPYMRKAFLWALKSLKIRELSGC